MYVVVKVSCSLLCDETAPLYTAVGTAVSDKITFLFYFLFVYHITIYVNFHMGPNTKLREESCINKLLNDR